MKSFWRMPRVALLVLLAGGAGGEGAHGDSRPAPRTQVPYALPETALRVSDGIYSGTTWKQISSGPISVPWQHAGGDWRDRSGVLQGPAPWATADLAPSNAQQLLSLDVTDLVQRHLAAGPDRIPNRGWIVKFESGKTIGTYRSREHSQTDARPRLEVTTASGKHTLTAGADIAMSPSSSVPRVGAAPAMAVESGSRIAIWFDLAALRAPVTHATLILTSTEKQYGGGSGGRIGVYPVDLSDTFVPIPIDKGLAGKYRRDEGIEKDPDVIFVERFRDPDMHKRGWYLALDRKTDIRAIVGNTDAADSNYRPLSPGITAYKMTIPKGQLGGNFGKWSLWSNLGYEPEELYIRAYARIGTDFDSMGGKFPLGFDGGYQRRATMPLADGHLLAANPVTGRPWVRADAPAAAGNGSDRSNGRNGWTARGGFFAEDCLSLKCEATAANPLIAAGYRPLSFYAYHRDQVGYTGDSFSWNRGLLGVVPKNQWVAIDEYVKLNTVNADGSGKRDGILRAWVNGRLAYEKTDFRVRDWPGNPEGARNIRIDSVWLNFYHGGVDPARSPMTVYLAHLVVAKSFIGPGKFE